MSPRPVRLRRVLPHPRELRRIVRQGRALAGALMVSALALEAALAIVAAGGWQEPSFAMSKLTRADMPDAGRPATSASHGPSPSAGPKT